MTSLLNKKEATIGWDISQNGIKEIPSQLLGPNGYLDIFRHFSTISNIIRRNPTFSDQVECRKMSEYVAFASKLPENAFKIKIRTHKIFDLVNFSKIFF